MGGVDSMGFESILVSKGLPHAEFSEKCVIDAHRSITSHNDVRHLPPRTDPDGRSLAHPVLISDEWRQSEHRGKDGAQPVGEASASPE